MIDKKNIEIFGTKILPDGKIKFKRFNLKKLVRLINDKKIDHDYIYHYRVWDAQNYSNNYWRNK